MAFLLQAKRNKQIKISKVLYLFYERLAHLGMRPQLACAIFFGSDALIIGSRGSENADAWKMGANDSLKLAPNRVSNASAGFATETLKHIGM